MNQKGFSVVLILIGIIILAAGLIGGAYYLGTIKNRLQPQNPVVTSQSPQPTVSSTPDETANWKTYTEILSDYSIKYPSTFKPSGSTHVLLFNNLESDFISFTEFLDKSTIQYFKAGQFTLPYQQPSITVLKANGKNLQQLFDYFKQTVQDNQTNIEDIQNVKLKGMDAISFKARINVRRNINTLLLTNIFTVQNDKIYIFSYAPDADGIMQKVFNQMLPTVNFIKQSDANTPENTIINFYQWFISEDNTCGNYLGAPLTVKCPNTSIIEGLYISPNLRQNLQTKGHGFFCVEPTNDITVNNVNIQGGQAEATVHQIYSEGTIVDVTIKLVLVNNQWKIDDAICPQTSP